MALPVQHGEANEDRPLRHWEPFRQLEDLHSQMGELMDNVMAPLAAINGVRAPVAEIEETGDAWIVEAELPGVDGNDVKVERRDSELLISGAVKEPGRTGVLRRRTHRTGRFEFRVSLPGAVDADKIEAKLHSRVLTVRIPKAEQAQPPRLELDAEQS